MSANLARHWPGLRGRARSAAAWDFARSSFYALKSRQHATAERRPAKRRGPKPSISDQALLVAIEADLEASPWEGEGHRKVLGSASGLSWRSGLPASGCSG